MVNYSQLSLGKNVKMAIYSQLSLAKKKKKKKKMQKKKKKKKKTTLKWLSTVIMDDC